MSCCCHEDHCAVKPADGEFPQAPVVGCRRVSPDFCGEKAKVYFTRKIDAEHLKKLYALVNEEIIGKVAIKLHTGERHGPNILPRDMVEAFQKEIPDSTIVETNTLYVGDRDTTEKHLETLKVNGWTFCPVDIMDAEGTTMLPVKGGKHFKAVSMGKNIRNYDSMVVLTHFKGHAMGGFGGGVGGSHEELCGAVSGGVLVLSLLHPHTDGEDRAGKVRLYAQAKEFRRRFQEVFGLTRCGDLLRARPGVTERNPASQRLGVTAHCDNMIVTAVEILEQMLQEEPA